MEAYSNISQRIRDMRDSDTTMMRVPWKVALSRRKHILCIEWMISLHSSELAWKSEGISFDLINTPRVLSIMYQSPRNNLAMPMLRIDSLHLPATSSGSKIPKPRYALEISSRLRFKFCLSFLCVLLLESQYIQRTG